MMQNQKFSTEDVYVIASFGYFGNPSCDDLIYTSKEEAQKIANEQFQQYPNLKFTVMDLSDYIRENRDFINR